MRLFVDVDDTLVIWLDSHGDPITEGPNPYGANSMDWKPNTRLILELERWVQGHPDAPFIVWSGGGIDYAEQWANRLLHHLHPLILPKLPTVPHMDDIMIDDIRDMQVSCPIISPHEFRAEMLI